MKNVLKIFGLIIILGLSSISGWAQETEAEKPSFKDRFSYNGYLKDLRAVNIIEGGNTFNQDWLHNRMNFRYDFNAQLTTKVELRNRLFYGEIMKVNPIMADMLDVDPGSVDLSFNPIDHKSMVLNTFVDRAYLDWANDYWEFRIGRQRINWGQNLVWNPNDLFNVLNYTDFDYEERPGSDAIRVQRYFKNLSQIEVAYKYSDSLEGSVAAAMYRFNKRTYDIQFIVGKYLTDMAIGTGWAGNLKNASFKGEMTWFSPLEEGDDVFLASLSIDGTIGGDWYISGSTLFNSFGTNDSSRLINLSANNNTSNLSVKNLMPNKYSMFLSASKPLGDLLNFNLAGIYAIDLNGAFLMPSLTYSLREDLDLTLVGQSYVARAANDWINPINTVFLRLKWSH